MRRLSRRAIAARRGIAIAVEQSSPTQLAIRVGDSDAVSTVDSLWLRDNCPGGVNQTTQQREDDLFGVRPLPLPELGAVSVNGKGLIVHWKDENRVSSYSAEWLAAELDARRRLPREDRCRLSLTGSLVADTIETWDGARWQSELPEAHWDDMMNSDRGCLEWLQLIHRYGFGLLRGCPTGDKFDVSAVAERTAHYVRHSIYGGVWGFGPETEDQAQGLYPESDKSVADTAWATCGLPFHTDGCYVYDPPGLQMLHCVKKDCQGGESGLLDGFRCIERLREEDPAAFRTLQEVVFPFHSRDPVLGIDLRNETPVIVSDYHGKLRQVRFNNLDRSELPCDTPLEVYEAWNALACIVKDPAMAVHFTLEPGTTVVWDNWRLMHARNGFHGIRRMMGCYMNMEDFHSRMRFLQSRVYAC
eukprot:TRINITY_DN16671_c0_g1_i1.p1 TRINITY_DN16671_c0_g1~~TRINITY_DN16671_c0_g1_i1.p1  ORF type:complete len:446 (+),score=111.61 TRINITY_DN16671_c0_g1_i1:92-1339(+)